ncbi:MAG TPA: SET domain-containing protein-lysine N-methyltransferase [Candidatus Nanoarchaeia archaeon]|nr:SET domain-containing protein-lysine N-methyltransferase [Candidatus Nanoarchaeia archaeon]
MDVVVKTSKIHGKGVFAFRSFKKGEIVLRWKPKELTKEQVEQVSEKEKPYVSFLDGKYLLEQPPERYVNHSCDPNTTVQNLCDVAKRDIKKGEEITSDYAETALPDLRMDCKCGSRKCRGVIETKSTC